MKIGRALISIYRPSSTNFSGGMLNRSTGGTEFRSISVNMVGDLVSPVDADDIAPRLVSLAAAGPVVLKIGSCTQ